MLTKFQYASPFVCVLAVIQLYSIPLHACLNEYEERPKKPSINDKLAETEDQKYYRYITELYVTSLSNTDESTQEKRNSQFIYQNENDDAVRMIKAGEYQKAIVILERLNKEHPDEYTIMANLGTAYELTGDVHKALEWIKKAYEINPDSHAGTEWLHVLILEAKLKQQTDPRWIQEHGVLGISFGMFTKPEKPVQSVQYAGKPIKLRETRKALEYQLRERLAFVHDPDPVVGDLLVALGNILVLDELPDHAFRVFELANKYQVQKNPLLETKIKLYQPVPDVSHIWYMRNDIRAVAILSLITIILGAWYYKRSHMLEQQRIESQSGAI